jgi:hypothetical protein
MPGLAQLTTAVSFAALGFSLWLGCYVITQSPRSRLAWQAGLTLWSLGGIFLDILITITPSPLIDWWQGWPILISVAIWYHLSLETLPVEYAKRQRQRLPLIYLYAVAFDIISGFTPWVLLDSHRGLGVTIKLFTLGPLYFLQPISYIGLPLLMLYNFWQARQSAPLQIVRKQLDSIVRGSALGVAGLVYGVVAITFKIPAPTLPLVILVGLAIVAVGYDFILFTGPNRVCGWKKSCPHWIALCGRARPALLAVQIFRPGSSRKRTLLPRPMDGCPSFIIKCLTA